MVVACSLEVEEARNLVGGSLEVGEVCSLEAGIAVVGDSHVADPGRGRRTWWRGMKRRAALPLPNLRKAKLDARVAG